MPTTRYFDQFLGLRCREELTMNRLFPDAKELTESFAAANAAITSSGLEPDAADVTAIVIGDGSTPRTAATLALRTKWNCISVDPALRADLVQAWLRPIARVAIRPIKVQSLAESIDGPCIVVAVHAHVRLARAMEAVRRCGADVVAAVAIPCCGYAHDAPGLSLLADYSDWGIWSPERRVLVWGSAGT